MLSDIEANSLVIVGMTSETGLGQVVGLNPRQISHSLFTSSFCSMPSVPGLIFDSLNQLQFCLLRWTCLKFLYMTHGVMLRPSYIRVVES